MHLGSGPIRLLRIGYAVIVVLLTSLTVTAPADAHAELLQASPRVGSVVGGEFHSVSMQFIGLDQEAAFRAELLDPSGAPIGGEPVREKQRIVIPIEPLEVPGTYTVSYTTLGVDGDLVSDLFTFRFDPGAAAPEGIDIELGGEPGFDWVGYGLLLVGAALLAFLVHRFQTAWRDHKRAAALAPADAGTDEAEDAGESGTPDLDIEPSSTT